MAVRLSFYRNCDHILIFFARVWEASFSKSQKSTLLSAYIKNHRFLTGFYNKFSEHQDKSPT